MLVVQRAVSRLWLPGQVLGPSRLTVHTLGFVGRGTARYQLGEPATECVVSRGSLLWLPRQSLRRMEPAGEGVYLHSIQVASPREFAASAADSILHLLPDELHHQPAVVEVLNPAYVEGLFKRSAWLLVERAPHHLLELAGLVLQILAHLLRAREGASVAPHLRRQVAAVLDYIAAHYTRPGLRLEELAAIAGWSPRYLIAAFRRVTGETPMAYVRRLRIQLGLELLATGSLKVAEVAEAVGFQDPAYFSRLFSRYVGRPPSAYIGNGPASG